MSKQQLIVCTFDPSADLSTVRAAIEALEARLERRDHLALVERTADGEVRYREIDDERADLSEMAGAAAGGAMMFLYSLVGLPAPTAEGYAAGYWTENAAYRTIQDMGFPDEALEALGERLNAGSAAFVALVEPEERDIVVSELQRLGGTLSEHLVAPEILAELAARGHE